MFYGKNKTNSKKVITDTRNNKFLDSILKTLSTPVKNGHTPDSSDIFKELMVFYIKISQEKYLRVIPAHFFNHVEDAKRCLAFFNEEEHKANALSKAINYLNTQQANNALKKIDINIDGSFGLLLSTYFAMFPNKLKECSAELSGKIKRLDLWDHAITRWVNEMMRNHRNGSGGHDHELLEYLSTVIPDSMVDDYSHFLIHQLGTSGRQESAKGLYKGWLYAALGKLLPRMTSTQASLVTNLLLQNFNARTHDLSLIGLSDALTNANISDKQKKDVADRLYTFTMDELKELAKLHDDHHPPTTSLYMEKLFLTLRKMEGHFNNDRRNGLINPMIEQSEYLYTLRNSILTMESWIPALSKLKVMERLVMNENVLTLAPMFWHWFINDKNHNTPWAQSHQFNKHIQQARQDLMDIFNNESTIADDVRLLIADNSTKPEFREDIVDNLIDELNDLNRDGVANQVRKELHLALTYIKPWADTSRKIKIFKLLLQGARQSSGDIEEVRVSAARAAAEYSELFSQGEATTFKNSIVPLLEGSNASKASEALQVFATKRNIDDLPEFLTSLLTKNNAHAQLLLATLYKTYMAHDNPVEHKIKLAG